MGNGTADLWLEAAKRLLHSIAARLVIGCSTMCPVVSAIRAAMKFPFACNSYVKAQTINRNLTAAGRWTSVASRVSLVRGRRRGCYRLPAFGTGLHIRIVGAGGRTVIPIGSEGRRRRRWGYDYHEIGRASCRERV